MFEYVECLLICQVEIVLQEFDNERFWNRLWGTISMLMQSS